MADGPSFNLVNLEGLSEPATKLVEAVSSAIGTLYAPFGTVRQARADAKATVIRAEANAEAASIAERAASRIEHREALRQQNIEKIISVAAHELPERVSGEPVDLDWMLQYLNYAQDVSSDDMQTLWGRILAGEVATPGRYSKRTLAFLPTLEKWEAQAFTNICSLALEDHNGWRFLLHTNECEDVRREIIGADAEAHLASIGLIRSEVTPIRAITLDGAQVSYFGQNYYIRGPRVWWNLPADVAVAETATPLDIRLFTVIGQQLANISGATPIDGYIERLVTSNSNVGFAIVPIPSTPNP